MEQEITVKVFQFSSIFLYPGKFNSKELMYISWRLDYKVILSRLGELIKLGHDELEEY